jgi:hypothetical protein
MKSCQNLGKRDLQAEIMDDPEIGEELHEEALAGLGRLNRLSGIAGAIVRQLKSVFRTPGVGPLKVLDIATGGGDIPVAVAKSAARHGLAIEIDACDKSETALRFARKRARDHGARVNFFRFELGAEPIPRDYDVLISTLFLHHLSQEQTVSFLRDLSGACRRGMILNDLRRCCAGLMLTSFLVPVLTRSSVVRADSVQSLRAAYTLPEIKGLAARAGIPDARLRSAWPCRFELIWTKK